MAPHSQFLSSILLLLVIVIASSIFVYAEPNTHIYLGRRTLLAKTLKQQYDDEETPTLIKKKKVVLPDQDHEDVESLKKKRLDNDAKTKLVKPIGGLGSSKNKTKSISADLENIKLKKLNSTEKTKSTKPNSEIKLKKFNSTSNSTKSTKPNSDKKKQAPPSPDSWMYASGDDDNDFISEFRQLPTKFKQTFIPDLHRISTSSQNYLTKANKEMTKNVKPYVGNRLAPSVTIAISAGIFLLPLLLLSLIFNKVKAYFSLQRLIVLAQIYLSIYFYTLCLSSFLTGLEPLRFFYATSQYTYVWVQALQTVGYVIYLLLLLMCLILVFSSDTSLGQKCLGLGQTFVGISVGLHYYVTVIHRMVLHEPPVTNWKVHGIYATCFLVICLSVGGDRRKKAYLVKGGEDRPGLACRRLGAAAGTPCLRVPTARFFGGVPASV